MSDLLTRLNDEQRKAVEHIGSPLLILAGPGTGKTRVTSMKLAHLILERGYKQEEILALTFSEKAAQEMQERVKELIPGSSRVQIHTFHSFCLEVVREYALELGVNARGDVFTDEFQQAFILEHLDEFGIEHFTVPPRPIELAQTFQGAIARFKQENISIHRLENYLEESPVLGGEATRGSDRVPEDGRAGGSDEENGDAGTRGSDGVPENRGAGGSDEENEDSGTRGSDGVPEHGRAGRSDEEDRDPGTRESDEDDGDSEHGPDSEETLKLRDLAKVYREYESFKRHRGLIDFGDMQLLALKLFREWPAVAAKYRDRFKHIIVDEFQDTDYIQLQILFRLAPDGNITIVGDDDQAIYRFRGAYLTNIREFTNFYRDKGIEPENILLRRNYRCTPDIQTVAGKLISNNPERKEKEIIPDRDSREPVHITIWQTDVDQARGITQRIMELHEEARPWGDLAILVRRRTDARPIIEELERLAIPYEVLGSRPFFGLPIIRALVSYLKVLHDPILNQPALGHVLLRPNHGILPGEIPRLSRFAREKHLSLWECLNDLEDYDGETDRLKSFRRSMEELFAIKGEKGILPLVRKLVLGREFMATEIAARNLKHVRLLNRFLDITNRFVQIYPDASLAGFLIHLEALRDLGIEDVTKEPSSDRVHLMTVHGSKGKEFPIVFVPCLNRNRFPSRYQRYKIEIPGELLGAPSSTRDPKELHEQEERRLLYVAITRARGSCYLSACERYGSNVRETALSGFLFEIMETEAGWSMTEPWLSEDKTELPQETHADAVYSRIISDIHRQDWQGAINGLAALAALHDAGIEAIHDAGMQVLHDEEVEVLHDTGVEALHVPGKEEVNDYLKAIVLREKQIAEEHLKGITYSPSRLNVYESCPKKYWYGYVMGIPGEWKSYFALGSVVHEVIEIVTRKIMDGKKGTEVTEGTDVTGVTEEKALQILDGLWRSTMYESREKEREDREDAEVMIRMFMARQSGKEGTILGVEEWIGLDLEGRRLRGKVDRIDMKDGLLEVIDYKSSKRKTSRPQLKQDFQMALYWLGVEQAYRRKVKKVGHWYLRMDREWMVEITREELEEVRQRAIRVIEGIEAGEFRAEPGRFKCQWCDYQMLCDERWK